MDLNTLFFSLKAAFSKDLSPEDHPRRDHEGLEGGVYIQLYSFFNLGARSGWVVNATPWPLYPKKRTWCPLYRRLGGSQGWSGWAWKISNPLGFEPWTVQPNYATQPMLYQHRLKFIWPITFILHPLYNMSS